MTTPEDPNVARALAALDSIAHSLARIASALERVAAPPDNAEIHPEVARRYSLGDVLMRGR